MIDIDVDGYEFGGFAGVRSGVPSASRFTVQMCSVPREGETIHVARSLMPDIFLPGLMHLLPKLRGNMLGTSHWKWSR